MKTKLFGLLFVATVCSVLGGGCYGFFKLSSWLDAPSPEQEAKAKLAHTKLTEAETKAGDLVILEGADWSSQDEITIGVIRWRTNTEVAIGTLSDQFLRVHLSRPYNRIQDVIHLDDPRWQVYRDRMIFGPKKSDTQTPSKSK